MNRSGRRMGTPAYKKCPRCELNYIRANEDLCDVCKAELKLAPNKFADDDEEEEGILCPVCKKNYIGYDEEMCAACREKLEAVEPDPIADDESDESWRAFLDDDKPVVEIPAEENEKLLSELEEEEITEDEDDEIVPLPDVDDDFPELDEEDFVEDEDVEEEEEE